MGPLSGIAGIHFCHCMAEPVERRVKSGPEKCRVRFLKLFPRGYHTDHSVQPCLKLAHHCTPATKQTHVLFVKQG